MKILHISDTHGCHRRLRDLPDADADVLITHTPLYGILDFDADINYGSEELLSVVTSVAPRLHFFGHIHRHHGVAILGPTIFSNAAIMNSDYSSINTPNSLEI